MTFAVVRQVQQRLRHFLVQPCVTSGKAHEAVRDFCKDLHLRRAVTRSHARMAGGMFGVSRRVMMRRNSRLGGEFMEPEDRPKWGWNADHKIALPIRPTFHPSLRAFL